jgi:hypothetical protein
MRGRARAAGALVILLGAGAGCTVLFGDPRAPGVRPARDGGPTDGPTDGPSGATDGLSGATDGPLATSDGPTGTDGPPAGGDAGFDLSSPLDGPRPDLAGGACSGGGTADDPHHCGPCNIDCTLLPGIDHSVVGCTAGVCQITCQPNLKHCSTDVRDGCETDITTAAHCGGCSTMCSLATPLCLSGGCVGTCPSASPDLCGTTTCTNRQTDPFNCSACGHVCPEVLNAARTCAAGVCGFACNTGWRVSGGGCVRDWSAAASGDTNDFTAV